MSKIEKCSLSGNNQNGKWLGLKGRLFFQILVSTASSQVLLILGSALPSSGLYFTLNRPLVSLEVPPPVTAKAYFVQQLHF